MTALPAGPCDVLAVWNGDTLPDQLIRIGEVLEGHPAVANHVVIITHQDQLGRWMGIQGQPGGVGLVDCTPFLNDSRTRSNHDQPRPGLLRGGQGQLFLVSAAKTIGIRYDWVGIAEDVAGAVHAPDLSAELDHLYRWPADHNLLPGHVVCSSLAAMLYDLPDICWEHPDLGAERRCEPADWWDWSDRQIWNVG